jgi:hypothetical protein
VANDHCGGHRHGATHGLARHNRLARKAWGDRSDYLDHDPRAQWQIDRLRHFRKCARPGTHRDMRGYAADQRREYRAWQSVQAYNATLPYDCGSWGRFVVPCSVIACESGGSWSASNGGSYVGPYQLWIGHGPPWPVYSEADKRAHHEVARRVLADQGPSAWSCW